MSKQKLFDVILTFILIVLVVVCVVLALRLAFKKSAVAEEPTDVSEVTVDNSTIEIVDDPQSSESIDDLNTTEPVLELPEVIDFIDSYSDSFGYDATVIKQSNSGLSATVKFNNSDVCFDVKTSQDGVTSIGELYNKLGDYPLVAFTGLYPDSKTMRKEIYNVLHNKSVYGVAAVYYEGNGSSIITVYPYQSKSFTVNLEDVTGE